MSVSVTLTVDRVSVYPTLPAVREIRPCPFWMSTGLVGVFCLRWTHTAGQGAPLVPVQVSVATTAGAVPPAGGALRSRSRDTRLRLREGDLHRGCDRRGCGGHEPDR